MLALLILTAASLGHGACRLPDAGAPLEESCPQLAPHLREWRGGPAQPPLCDAVASTWRRCRLKRDGLLSEVDVLRAEHPHSAVLASRLYAALVADGVAPPAARAAALPFANLGSTVRPVRAGLPTLDAPPVLAATQSRPACQPPVHMTAGGGLSYRGQALDEATDLVDQLWTTIPALSAALEGEPGCTQLDVWAAASVPLEDLVPVLETLHVAGHRTRLLGISGGHAGVYAPISALPLRLAPGGQAHVEALPLSAGEDVGAVSGWTGAVHFSAPGGTVSDLATLSRDTAGDAVVWLSTTRSSLAETPESALVGTLLLPGTPAARDMRQRLDQGMSAVTACYEAALARRPSLSGTLEATVALDAAGIQAVRLSGALDDVGMRACVWGALSALPLTAKAPVVVTYPLAFAAE